MAGMNDKGILRTIYDELETHFQGGQFDTELDRAAREALFFAGAQATLTVCSQIARTSHVVGAVHTGLGLVQREIDTYVERGGKRVEDMVRDRG
jgi:hypothetical protein